MERGNVTLTKRGVRNANLIPKRDTKQQREISGFQRVEAWCNCYFSVAMPADSRREKIFDFVREFAVKYFRIVPVRDSTQQNKA